MAPWTAVYSPASPAAGPAAARPVRPLVASASTKTMAEFDLVRSKALAVLRSDEWRAERAREAPKMKRYFPQIVRIKELGLLTFDSIESTKSALRVRARPCVHAQAHRVGLAPHGRSSSLCKATVVRTRTTGFSAADVMLRTTAGLFPVTANDGAVGTDGTMEIHSTVSPFTAPYYRHVAGKDPVPDS
jgi:hypothetical protein